MTEIKIVQDDSGKITVETTGPDGEPVITDAASVDEAIESAKEALGGGEDSESAEIDMESEMPEGVPAPESKGRTLEDNVAMMDKEKSGMMPKKKPGWDDYGIK